MFIGIDQNIMFYDNLSFHSFHFKNLLPRPIKKNKNLLPIECIQLILTSFHFPLSKDTFKKFMEYQEYNIAKRVTNFTYTLQ
jgi:hypothetical protein